MRTTFYIYNISDKRIHVGQCICRGISSTMEDNKGLGIIRVKPIGAGGGGGESSSNKGFSAIKYSESTISIDGKSFSYPKMVVTPDTSQESLFNEFMPDHIQGFLDGYNVNIIAYGQTGSGKTYTVFGPPGCMDRAGKGDYGNNIHENYGLFPRALYNIFHRLEELKESASSNAYMMTCAAVELSSMGNEDMFNKSGNIPPSSKLGSASCGVVLDRSSKPPRLYGQCEMVIEKKEDLLCVFSALAVRNTSGTLMNDSSSRSHCIVSLRLWKYEKSSQNVSISRFQFCDLAGSERMHKTYADGATYKKPNGGWNLDVIQGMSTNFSLMELSRCLQDISMVRKAKRDFNFRAYVTDLPFLLSDTIVGNALTACFVCISQAISNKAESRAAMDFGKRFSSLSIKRQKVEDKVISEIEKKAINEIETNERHLKTIDANNPYTIMREAQIKDCEQILNIVQILNS